MNRNKLTILLSAASIGVAVATFILSSSLPDVRLPENVNRIAEVGILNYANPLPVLFHKESKEIPVSAVKEVLCYLPPEKEAVQVMEIPQNENEVLSSNFSPSFPVKEEHFILTSPMGERINPDTQEAEFHFGIDIESHEMEGQSVYAALPGVISNIAKDEKLGSYVVIKHGELSTLYANLNEDEIKVSIGQRVFSGDTIGSVGTEGCGSRALLHFELDKNGERLDPMILFEEIMKEKDLDE